MPVNAILDHSDQAVANLISKFASSPNLAAIVRIFVDEVQELDNIFFALVYDQQLDGAAGIILDRYGELVGEPRDGLADPDYRNFIRARILTNLAEGQPERIIEVLALITNAVQVHFQPTYPAAFIVQYIRNGTTSAGFQNRVLQQVGAITPSGVGYNVVEANVGAFGFEGDPDALGFGEGEWSSIF